MANFEVDPSNLKSFQRISPEDLRYLKELGEAIAVSRQEKKARSGEIKINLLELIFNPKKLVLHCKNSLDKMLYETVPVTQVYASRE